MFGQSHGYQPKSGSGATSKTPSGGSSGQKPREIRYLGDLQRLELRPGDILVLSVDAHISQEMAARLQADFREVTDAKVIVVGKGMKLGVISAEAA
jgi:hypothetical protein